MNYIRRQRYNKKMIQRKKINTFLRLTTNYLTTYLFNPHLQKIFLFTPTLYFRYRKDTRRAKNQRKIPKVQITIYPVKT